VECVTMCKVKVNGEIINVSEETVEVDFDCIAGGLYPLAELATVAGCPTKYVEELCGHIPVHSEQMETPLDERHVARNITGIIIAKVAREQGTVAGHSIAKRVAKKESPVKRQLKKAMKNVKKTRAEASIQFHPGIEDGRNRLYKQEI